MGEGVPNNESLVKLTVEPVAQERLLSGMELEVASVQVVPCRDV